MKNLFAKLFTLIIVTACLANYTVAQTTIDSVNITSTTWTKANSPYTVNVNITVPAGNTLIIESGVQVIFSGAFSFNVNGSLMANGTLNDTILFTSSSASWAGFSLNSSAKDSTIMNYCKIEKSNSTGLYISSSRVLIQHSHIYNNSYSNKGGGIICANSSPKILHNVIEKNTSGSDGGGIFCTSSSAEIKFNTIKGNYARAAGGGIRLDKCAAIIANNLICENSAGTRSGGFEAAYQAKTGVSLIINNTIVRNTKGGAFSWQTPDIYTNNAIWGNVGSQLGANSPAPVVSYCAIQGGYNSGKHIINLNSTNTGDTNSPMFTNPDTNDYTLQVGSPLIAAGNPTGLNIGHTSPDTIEYIIMKSSAIGATVNPTFGYAVKGAKFDYIITANKGYAVMPDSTSYNGINVLSEVDTVGGITKFNIENVSEPGVLYASCPIITYTITYNANGGINPNTIAKYNVNSPDIILEDASLADSTFIGWYNNADFTGEPITQIKKGSIGNIEFWAKFSTTYYITYNLNGGLLSDVITEYTVESDTLMLQKPTKDGFDFVGWYTNAELTGNSITYIAKGSRGDTALWAKYTVLYTITYNLNGGALVDPINVYSVISDTIKLQNPIYGYEFLGWYTNAAFTGDSITQIVTGSTGDTAFWAKWDDKPIVFNISYHFNGGSIADTITEYTIESADLEMKAATKKAYVFLGWFNNENYDGVAITKIDSGSYGDLELWAKWKAESYTITYHINSGGMTDSIAEYTIESKTISLTTFTNGYAFLGWYNNANLTGDVITEIAHGSTGDTAFWAKWDNEPLVFSITYNLNGGELSNAVSEYTIESNEIKLGIPTLADNKFLGWYNNPDLSGDSITKIKTGSFGNMEFWAKWQKSNGIVNPASNLVSTYPNPINNKLIIDITDNSKLIKIEVCNISGAVIYSSVNISQKTYEIDLSNQPAGLLLVKTTSINGLVSIQKIIKN